jgi:hypothetical protein
MNRRLLVITTILCASAERIRLAVAVRVVSAGPVGR